MATLITKPTRVESAGNKPKTIDEFVGRVNSQTSSVSIARMHSPAGWKEPGQSPEFDEYTLVLSGTVIAETKQETIRVGVGQALHVPAGEWVRYSTPETEGAEYVSVCLPAFSPEIVHRDE